MPNWSSKTAPPSILDGIVAYAIHEARRQGIALEKGLVPMIDFIAGEEHEVTAILAYRLWEERGRPIGSPEVDWFEAKNQLAEGLAKDDAGIAIFATGMGAREGPWRPRQDRDSFLSCGLRWL